MDGLWQFVAFWPEIVWVNQYSSLINEMDEWTKVLIQGDKPPCSPLTDLNSGN